MEHRDVGVGAFLPADENSAESIHPAMGPLDDPAPRFNAGGLLDRLRLLASAADMGGEAELLREGPNFVIVVALVEAETLRGAFLSAQGDRWECSRTCLAPS